MHLMNPEIRQTRYQAVLPFILLLLLQAPGASQTFSIRTFNSNNGLPHNTVRAMASDSTGYLWIATWDGLARYNGYEFRNYYHIPGDSASLPYFSVRDIDIDGSDNLWILCDDGQFVRYNRLLDNFEKPFTNTFPVGRTNTSIDIDRKGDLWVIGRDKLIKKEHKTGLSTEYRIDDPGKGFNEQDYSSVYVVNENEIWLAGDKLYRLKKTVGSPGGEVVMKIVEKYQVATDLPTFYIDYPEIFWSEFYISSRGNKWVFSNLGLFRLSENGHLTEFKGKLPEGEFTGDTLFVWQSKETGINVFNPSSQLEMNLPREQLPASLSYYYQYRNLLWFSYRALSGNSLGLARVIITPKLFTSYGVGSGIKPDEPVYSIYKDRENTIWAGIRGKSYIQLIKPDGSGEAFNIMTSAESAETGHLRQIVPGNNGIWLGYYLEKLLFYDFSMRKFVRHYPLSAYFHTILPYSDRILLIASDGLLKYDVVTGRSEKIMEIRHGEGSIYCLYKDPDGIVWAGSMASLIRFDPAKDTSERIELNNENYNVECICPGENDDLWLALLGGGVCRYNRVTREKRYYTTSTGLSNNTTYSILRDKSGYIWVSTNDGISRIDPASGHIRVFDKSDGLDIVEFNSDAWFVAGDGEFYFGGVGGIAGFYPDSIDKLEEPAGRQKVMIDGIRVSGEVRHFRNNAHKADTVVLRKGENNFQVIFSSADFINSEKTVYRYRLSGVDKGWTETSYRNRNISYSNLKPGGYRLFLQATDSNGSWAEPKELVIRVQPVFTQTKFFIISVLLIILMLTGLKIWFYIRQVKHREARKQDALRLQALQGQMNPHFIFNSLNSINYFISKKDPLSANRYISDFSKVIRSILHNFNSEFITLEKETESIEDYLNIEYLRFGDKFNFEVTVAPGLPSWQIMVSPGLIQPFVENAIWHGVRGLENRKGRISVRFEMNCNNLLCIIEDDGIGRKRSEEFKDKHAKKSQGISLASERLKIINNLYDTSYGIRISDLYPDKTETGTRVEIDVPVMKGGRK